MIDINFKEVDIKKMQCNPMELMGEDWMALTAGNEKDGSNSMCIAWGHLGSLWELESHSNRLPTAIVYVRPTRYTKEFLDREEYFSLSTLDKKALVYLGTHSGKDSDKIKDSGLTLAFEQGVPYFEEASMVLICRKLYHAPLVEEEFCDKEIVEFNYPDKDFHEMYIGEVVKTLIRE